MTVAKLWTTAEIDRLKKLIAQGVTDAEIAEKLGRVCGSVMKKRQSLGIARAPKRGSPRSAVGRASHLPCCPITVKPCPLTLKPNDNKVRDAMAAALERGEGVEGAMLAVMKLRGLVA